VKRGMQTCNGVPCMRVEVGGQYYLALASRYAVVDGFGADHRGVWWEEAHAVPFSEQCNAVAGRARIVRVTLYWYVPELRGVYPQVRAIPPSRRESGEFSKEAHSIVGGDHGQQSQGRRTGR
jgi:hypothetical protein